VRINCVCSVAHFAVPLSFTFAPETTNCDDETLMQLPPFEKDAVRVAFRGGRSCIRNAFLSVTLISAFVKGNSPHWNAGHWRTAELGGPFRCACPGGGEKTSKCGRLQIK